MGFQETHLLHAARQGRADDQLRPRLGGVSKTPPKSSRPLPPPPPRPSSGGIPKNPPEPKFQPSKTDGPTLAEAGIDKTSPIGRVDGSIAATSAGHSHAGAAWISTSLAKWRDRLFRISGTDRVATGLEKSEPCSRFAGSEGQPATRALRPAEIPIVPIWDFCSEGQAATTALRPGPSNRPLCQRLTGRFSSYRRRAVTSACRRAAARRRTRPTCCRPTAAPAAMTHPR